MAITDRHCPLVQRSALGVLSSIPLLDETLPCQPARVHPSSSLTSSQALRPCWKIAMSRSSTARPGVMMAVSFEIASPTIGTTLS